MIVNMEGLSYEERRKCLKLWTLEERRNRQDLIEVFKISQGKSGYPTSRQSYWAIFLAKFVPRVCINRYFPASCQNSDTPLDLETTMF